MHPAHEVYQKGRTLQDRISDKITDFAGSMTFIYLHVAWFCAWIMSGIEKFPFGLLTMIVSLEAIFLSTFVMISQNRAANKDRATAQLDYETNTKALKLIEELHKTISS